jgi:Fe-S cluster assembly iron-binding protein IscA
LALALDESVQEGQDQLEETDGVTIIYDKNIAPHVNDRIIDYHTGPQGGFSIKKETPDLDCGSCC